MNDRPVFARHESFYPRVGWLWKAVRHSETMPEVFLKAVALARNQGTPLDGLTTVNFDFIRQYRAQTNVVARPVAGVGKGYAFTGHHEIMLPLLAAALIDAR